MNFVLTREFLEDFKHAVKSRDKQKVLLMTKELYPADISGILDELATKECKFVIEVLDSETAADILSDLDEDIRPGFLERFKPEEVAQFIDHMDSDDAVDVLSEMPVKFREETMPYIESREKASDILDLLRYEEDCAGGIMAKELIKVNINQTVVQCIEEIRRQTESVDKIYSVYVTDDENVLLGRVSLKLIILSDDSTLIRDIYVDDVIAVHSYEKDEEVARLMQKYDLEAMPVVNVQNKLIGRITVDDILDVITEQAELDRLHMSGISEDIEEDDSIWKLSRARLPWLLIGMFGGLVGAQFIGFFEKDLALVPAMAFFIPLITATGGNVGIQSSTIIVQALADNSGIRESALWRILKSFAVALLNGVVIAAVVFGSNMLILSNGLKLSAVVSVALFSVVLIASFMGTVTPLVLDRIKINPAVASGPFITTANDLIGLAIYFSVAKVLFNT